MWGHVARMGNYKGRQNFVGEREWKIPFVRPLRTCEDNIKIGLK